jgi:hypothetical protein
LRKHAQANLYSRLISRLLGISGMTIAELRNMGYGGTAPTTNVSFATRKGETQTEKKARQAAPKKSEFKRLDELGTVADGSYVSTAGVVDSVSERTVNTKNGPRTVQTVMLSSTTPDLAPVSQEVSYWEARPEWLVTGVAVEVTKCKVESWNGKKRISVFEWQPVEVNSGDAPQ